MVHTEEGLARDRTAHERSRKAMEKILGQTFDQADQLSFATK